MKKYVSILLCTTALLCMGSHVLAAPPVAETSVSVTPRYTTIRRTTEGIAQNGKKITCTGVCTAHYEVDNITVRITLRDKATSKEISSSGSSKGLSYTYNADFNVVKGKSYTVTYDYNAGGEKVTRTKQFTAK